MNVIYFICGKLKLEYQLHSIYSPKHFIIVEIKSDGDVSDENKAVEKHPNNKDKCGYPRDSAKSRFCFLYF